MAHLRVPWALVPNSRFCLYRTVERHQQSVASSLTSDLQECQYRLVLLLSCSGLPLFGVYWYICSAVKKMKTKFTITGIEYMYIIQLL